MSTAPPPPFVAEPVYLDPRRTSVAAIVSLVCGILGCLVVTPFIAILCGIVGIAATRKPNVTGRGMAIAGSILGVLWLGAGILSVVGGVVLYHNSEAPAEVARQFTRDLVAGDVAAAQKNTTLSAVEVQDLADGLKPLGAISDITLNTRNANSVNGKTRWDLAGSVTFANGVKGVSYGLQPTQTGYTVLDVTFR